MSIETKFGTAYVDTHGYLRISSVKEGNHNKLVHRLVFEDFYNISLNEEFPDGVIIHHEDGNKLNNEIWNLVPMTNQEHSIMHHTGVKFTEERCRKISEAKKGFKYTEESKQKMREAKLGKSQPMEMMLNRSKTVNKIGLFRVFKAPNKSCKKGFDYCYNYTENNKRKEIHSVDILKLRKRVIEKGLPWIVVDVNKVKAEFGDNLADRILSAISEDSYES